MQKACQIGAHRRAAHIIQRRDEGTLGRRLDNRLKRREHTLAIALTERN